MKFKISLTITTCLFLFVQLLSAQNNIGEHKPLPAAELKAALTGTITDATSGEPIADASVVIPDLKSGAHSDATGHYSISNIPPGRYLVEVSHVGYNSITEYIVFNGQETMNVKLQRSVTENESVTVTGVTTATKVIQSPIPVNVFRKKDLVLSGGTNLIDQLAKLGSIGQVSTGPAISKPVIRGLGYNRVVTVNDG
ncbi:MAG: carboxypeptidase-like regulatory domain-containing protein, partial [Dinghuibacter sp.]|nr:carboxypeptidase-like regulatory domain-containing protein [Dinghuibacter sp.]